MESVVEDRALLMNVAYRLVGTVSEAEDAVQEAFARWYALRDVARNEIASPTGWLVTVTTRICLDVLGSARVRRERYVGSWLPEPVPSATQWTSHSVADHADPVDRLSLDESLSMALLVVLEAMTPAERVAFTLHDVFGYTFAEIGHIVGRSEQASRQLGSTGRRRVQHARRGRATAEEHARVVSRFKIALDTGDLRALLDVLDPDATAIPDGGGLVAANIAPVVSAEAIADYLFALLRQLPGLTFDVTTVNGRAGLIGREGTGPPAAVLAMAVTHGRIDRIWAIRNPTKLTNWSCLVKVDLSALLWWAHVFPGRWSLVATPRANRFPAVDASNEVDLNPNDNAADSPGPDRVALCPNRQPRPIDSRSASRSRSPMRRLSSTISRISAWARSISPRS